MRGGGEGGSSCLPPTPQTLFSLSELVLSMRYRGGLPAVSSGVVPPIALFNSLKVGSSRSRSRSNRPRLCRCPARYGHDEGKSGHSAAGSRASDPVGSGAPPRREVLRQTKSGPNFLTRPNHLSRPKLSNSSSKRSPELRRESARAKPVLKIYKELAIPDLFLQGDGSEGS